MTEHHIAYASMLNTLDSEVVYVCKNVGMRKERELVTKTISGDGNFSRGIIWTLIVFLSVKNPKKKKASNAVKMASKV